MAHFVLPVTPAGSVVDPTAPLAFIVGNAWNWWGWVRYASQPRSDILFWDGTKLVPPFDQLTVVTGSPPVLQYALLPNSGRWDLGPSITLKVFDSTGAEAT